MNKRILIPVSLLLVVAVGYAIHHFKENKLPENALVKLKHWMQRNEPNMNAQYEKFLKLKNNSKMKTVTVEEVTQLCQLLAKDDNYSQFHAKVDRLIEEGRMEYIERKEYWGEFPRLKVLQELEEKKVLPDDYKPGNLIYSFLDEKLSDEDIWENLSDDEDEFIRYEIPYFEHLNHYFQPFGIRLVALNLEHEYIFAVQIEDLPKLQGLDLRLYPPMNDEEVILKIKQHLPSLFDK